MLLNYGVGEDSWESLGLQGDPTSPSWRSVLGVHWKDWCWSWNSSTLATWWEDLTHLKRPRGWERLRAGGEVNDRGWDGWMASPTQWTGFGWTLGVGEWGGLACCSSWGRRELDMTEWLNWNWKTGTESKGSVILFIYFFCIPWCLVYCHAVYIEKRIKFGHFKNPCQPLLPLLPVAPLLLALVSRVNHAAKTSGPMKNWILTPGRAQTMMRLQHPQTEKESMKSESLS